MAATNTQGQWGELQLRRIVELAGMLSHCDFEVQQTFYVPNKQRADLVVKLPNGRTIIVDAKSPIDAYIDAHEDLDDETRRTRLQQYAGSVRTHVGKLAKKEYWRHCEPSPEWVVLFIPNEGMFRAAVEHDPKLLEEAIQQNVLLVSPVTLIALLKAVAYGWQQENRARNVQQIIEHTHALQRQLKTFVTDWGKLSKQLNGTVGSFNQLVKTYETTIFPVIQQIADLDGTTNPNEYNLSRLSLLQSPSSVEDGTLSIEESLTEN